MAALIENNEGHIEHMVAVVSPTPSLDKKKTASVKTFARVREKERKKKTSTSLQRTFASDFAPLFNERTGTVGVKGTISVGGDAENPQRVHEKDPH